MKSFVHIWTVTINSYLQVFLNLIIFVDLKLRKSPALSKDHNKVICVLFFVYLSLFLYGDDRVTNYNSHNF